MRKKWITWPLLMLMTGVPCIADVVTVNVEDIAPGEMKKVEWGASTVLVYKRPLYVQNNLKEMMKKIEYPDINDEENYRYIAKILGNDYANMVAYTEAKLNGSTLRSRKSDVLVAVAEAPASWCEVVLVKKRSFEYKLNYRRYGIKGVFFDPCKGGFYDLAGRRVGEGKMIGPAPITNLIMPPHWYQGKYLMIGMTEAQYSHVNKKDYCLDVTEGKLPALERMINAAACGYLSIVKEELERNPKLINERTDKGRVVMIAAMFANQNEIVEFLLNSEELDINQRVGRTARIIDTPIHKRDLKLLSQVLKLNPKLNPYCDDGICYEGALMNFRYLSIGDVEKECLNLLLENGADPLAKVNEKTILDYVKHNEKLYSHLSNYIYKK